MPNIRQFSVVIHDVPTGSKSLVQAALHKLAKKYVIALERYNHQEGYHLHLFYYLKSPSNILAQVRKWEAFKWGRVQVDPMRGTFDQASVYVISADKVKYQDANPIIYPPINGDGDKFCDCGYTTHMRYSLEAHRKLISGERKLAAWQEYHIELQSRLNDWMDACWCTHHKKWNGHVNDIFPPELKSLFIKNGRTQVREENHEEDVCEEVEEAGPVWGTGEAETSGGETDSSESESD